MQVQQLDNQQSQLLFNSQNESIFLQQIDPISQQSIDVNNIRYNDTEILQMGQGQFILSWRLDKIYVLIFLGFIFVVICVMGVYWNNRLSLYQQLSHITSTNNIPLQFDKIQWLRTYHWLKKHSKSIQTNNQYKAHQQKNTVSLQKQNKLTPNQAFKKYISSRIRQVTQQKDLQRLTFKYQLQLPICILINLQLFISDIQQYANNYKQIAQSIDSNNYSNYIIIQPHNSTIIHPKTKYTPPKKQNQTTFGYYRRIVMEQCQSNALVLMLKYPVHKDALWNVNVLHQKYNIWASYDYYQGIYQLFTFYQRIFQLVELNDFDHTHLEAINKDIRYDLTFAIIQLCVYHIKQFTHQQLYKNSQLLAKSQYEYKFEKDIKQKRTHYLPLNRLSQDIQISPFDDRIRYNMMKQKFLTDQQIINTQNLSMLKMQIALEYQDLIYLPSQHAISKKQLQYYNSLYNISLFTEESKQLPFCITILSHNNVQNQRYKKLILSIFQQQYQNYHIVFIDDVSTDQTLQKTINYVQKKRFNLDRIDFIRNTQRKYANYNILNAAFNFCHHNDIQVVIDGDDEIIGRHVFALINAAYHKQNTYEEETWIVYTNFKTNLYQFGRSYPIKNQLQFLTSQKKRVNNHFLGQLRTWRTAVIKTVPMKYHKNKMGNWLDTLYDDSIQHSIFELSGINKIKYIPQICYQYNREYGDNDDSSQQKIIYRLKTYDYILSLPALQPIQSLDRVVPNKELQIYFSQQKQIKQFTIVI